MQRRPKGKKCKNNVVYFNDLSVSVVFVSWNDEERKAVKEVRLVLVVARSIWERLVGYQVIALDSALFLANKRNNKMGANIGCMSFCRTACMPK